MRPFVLLFLAACTPETLSGGAVVGHPDPQNPALDPGEADPVVSVQRLSGDGPFLVGDTEEFSATLAAGMKASWSADAGELVQDGDHVWWTLPWEPGEHELSLTVKTAAGPWTQVVRVQTIALSPSAAGVVDASALDATGTGCALVIDSSDVPHILYTNDIHRQWRYARFNGSAWVNELVAGPGFLTGGLASLHAPGMVVDASGNVHVAIQLGASLYYGKRTPQGVWTIETVAPNTWTGQPVALLLDAGSPVLVDTLVSGVGGNGYSRVRVHRKSGTWSTVVQGTVTTSGVIGNNYMLRGAVLTGPSAIRFAMKDDSYRSMWTSTWTAANGFPSTVANVHTYNYDEFGNFAAPMVGGANYLGIYSGQAVHWSTDGGANWSNSPVYYGYIEGRGMAYDGTSPRLASEFNDNLEFARPDARGYWSFTTAVTEIDPSTNMSAALDSTGTLHACFRKNGQLWFQ
jgi:hypothetical protein